MSAPHDPIRQALIQAQKHINAALAMIPAPECLSLTKLMASWISDYATRLDHDRERQQLTQASQNIWGIILAVEPSAGASEAVSTENTRENASSPIQLDSHHEHQPAEE